MKRAESQVQTRQALLNAAVEVFGEHGLHGATLDDVASRAGLTKGAVYSNFGSKEELFLECFTTSFNRRRPTADKLNQLILDGDLDGASRVYQQIWADADTAQWLLGIEFLLWAKRVPRIRAMTTEFLDQATTATVEDVRAVSNGMERPDLRSMVIALAALDLGLGLLEDLVDDLDRPRTYVHVASRLLGGNPI
jgi:AcrR family transcriptional regulator